MKFRGSKITDEQLDALLSVIESGAGLKDGEVIGIDMDDCLVQWNAIDGIPYSRGEAAEQFGVENLSPAERLRVGLADPDQLAEYELACFDAMNVAGCPFDPEQTENLRLFKVKVFVPVGVSVDGIEAYSIRHAARQAADFTPFMDAIDREVSIEMPNGARVVSVEFDDPSGPMYSMVDVIDESGVERAVVETQWLDMEGDRMLDLKLPVERKAEAAETALRFNTEALMLANELASTEILVGLMKVQGAILAQSTVDVANDSLLRSMIQLMPSCDEWRRYLCFNGVSLDGRTPGVSL